MDGFLPQNQSVETIRKWYKTPGGIVFLSIIGIILAGVLFFMGTFTYYLWQIKYGNAADQLANNLKKQNNEIFGNKTTSTTAENVLIKDYSKYIRNYNPIKGKVGASVTVLMFVDFECPYCRQAYADFNIIMKRYSPVARFVFKNITGQTHLNALRAAIAATCAEEQNKFWEYYDLLFQKQQLDDNSLLKDAEDLNLDTTAFANCTSTEKYQDNINQDIMDAADLDILGTPTYFVNGVKYSGVMSLADWDKIILNSLKK